MDIHEPNIWITGMCTICRLPLNQPLHPRDTWEPEAQKPAARPEPDPEPPSLFDQVTPYNQGTSSGWSGSNTSRSRAEHNDSTGVTHKYQLAALTWLGANREHGGIVHELEAHLKTRFPEERPHHGDASSALTTLHMAEHVARLTETRSRCKVYVLPEYVQGRATEAQGRDKPGLTDEEAAALERLDNGMTHIRDIDMVCAALHRLTSQ